MSEPFLLGWEEWLALPDLGLPAIKAKVDTGARTSSLHADVIETFVADGQRKVRFSIRPVPGRDDIQIWCTADIVDQREVISSNGERELRYVIRTTAEMGGRKWPIEITLANRESMTYRMLLGRQAIQDDMFVDPATSFRQPRLSYNRYRGIERAQGEQRSLSIALFTRRPENASNRRLLRAAERRGHRTTILDRSRLSLYISATEPAIFLNGRPLTGVDAVVARATGALGSFSIAAVRQLEIMGAFALNPADALQRIGDPLALRQTLARERIPVLDAAVSHADLIKPDADDGHVLAVGAAVGLGPTIRFAIVGGRCLAALERRSTPAAGERSDWEAIRLDAPELQAARRVAESAARVMGLGLASIDVAAGRGGPVVLAVSTNVPIAQTERLADASIAEAIVVHIEQSLRFRPGRA